MAEKIKVLITESICSAGISNTPNPIMGISTPFF